jgi:hypothetical protein
MEEIMGTIPPAKQCGLYLPGHQVHWIQGLHAGRPGEAAPVSCRILEITDDGTITIDLSGEPLQLWTHDPVRLRAIAAEHGTDAGYQESWRLLWIALEGGRYAIDVTPASNPERQPCPTSPPCLGTLAEQLRATGGFTMRATDLAKALGVELGSAGTPSRTEPG